MVTAVATTRVPKLTVIVGGSFGAGNYSMCGRAYSPRFLWSWPASRISVMGGPQAASVLSTVKRDQLAARGEAWDPDEEAAFSAGIRADYDEHGSPYYATARLWDDGVIDPADTRRVLGLALGVCARTPSPRPGPVTGSASSGCEPMTSRTLHDATARPTGGPGFRTVLVANRGEIACRVIGTLRHLGVRSVAVFSDADADARHVREADVAVRLGPAPAAQSYLDVDAVVAAAVATGAEAVHPGYGFLSENPALARACARAGIAFVGPGVDALEAMADKLAAKSIVGARGVPVVPGAGEPGMSDDDLLAAAGAVGFRCSSSRPPGAGKGMVVVRAEADLPGALASARRVAASSFGDDTLLLERLVEAPRHIEVQVLADTHGTVVHLGERECSLQRRHQKVVEEAPSPLLTPRSVPAWARPRARSRGPSGTWVPGRSSSSSPPRARTSSSSSR